MIFALNLLLAMSAASVIVGAWLIYKRWPR